ncbi:hypothetical protein CEE69_21285 [Rhodopirellula bahusiensis]|uniref:Uncharacterized protein n=1 Tax=Rhodopirellula bahusiensis TaxID=2014065 RepID=A0A2G1W2J6_9BACT|nr:hypothetical protein CEE69_21285 [Rhodopirellula bahusiensis]
MDSLLSPEPPCFRGVDTRSREESEGGKAVGIASDNPCVGKFFWCAVLPDSLIGLTSRSQTAAAKLQVNRRLQAV